MDDNESDIPDVILGYEEKVIWFLDRICQDTKWFTEYDVFNTYYDIFLWEEHEFHDIMEMPPELMVQERFTESRTAIHHLQMHGYITQVGTKNIKGFNMALFRITYKGLQKCKEVMTNAGLD